MREKDKHSKTGPERFIRYRKGESPGAERNAFERELQKDPFAEEADEGFSSSGPESIGKDLEILRTRLARRIKSRQMSILYRIAASLAVLMVVTTVYFLATRKPGVMDMQTAELEKKGIASEPPAAPAESAVIEIAEPMHKQVKPQAGKEKQVTPLPVPAIAVRPAEEMKTAADHSEKNAKTETAEAEKAELYAVAEEIVTDTTETLIIQAKAAAEREAAPPVPEMRSKSIKSDNAAAAGMRKDASWSPYTPAQPVTGTDKFNRYLEENVRKPAIPELSEAVTVEVSFIVRLSGIPDSIIVSNNHPKPLSDEAARLINEGPRWKPATSNGKMIEERVAVKITFR